MAKPQKRQFVDPRRTSMGNGCLLLYVVPVRSSCCGGYELRGCSCMRACRVLTMRTVRRDARSQGRARETRARAKKKRRDARAHTGGLLARFFRFSFPSARELSACCWAGLKRVSRRLLANGERRQDYLICTRHRKRERKGGDKKTQKHTLTLNIII